MTDLSFAPNRLVEELANRQHLYGTIRIDDGEIQGLKATAALAESSQAKINDLEEELRRIKVTAVGQPVKELNELEYVKGEVLANVWQTDRIARINPATGEVTGWVDLSGLLKPAERGSYDAVLNGIAYDAATDRLFVTGKLWPKVFEIRLVKK